MRELWISIRQYFPAIGGELWGVVLGVLLGGVGTLIWLAERLQPEFYAEHFANWPSWIGPALVFASLVIAPFMAFHRMRVKHDVLEQQLKSTVRSSRVDVAKQPEHSIVSIIRPTSTDPLFIRIRIKAPDEETSFYEPWTLKMLDSVGHEILQAQGDLIGGNNHIRKGDQVQPLIRFQTVTKGLPPNAVRCVLTTSDVHDYPVKLEFPL